MKPNDLIEYIIKIIESCTNEEQLQNVKSWVNNINYKLIDVEFNSYHWMLFQYEWQNKYRKVCLNDC